MQECCGSLFSTRTPFDIRHTGVEENKMSSAGACGTMSVTHLEKALEPLDDARYSSGGHGCHVGPRDDGDDVDVDRSRRVHWLVPCRHAYEEGRSEKHRAGRGRLDQLESQQYENRQAPLEIPRVLGHVCL